METNKVTVRWFDGYMEEFEATEVRLKYRRDNKTEGDP